MSQNPTPELLRQLFRYEPESGKLFWLPRTVEFFRSTETRTAERQTNWWNSRNAGKEAFTSIQDGYKVGIVLRRGAKAHRVIWAMTYGYWPSEVDHINGDRTDNRISNLREVTRSENCRNRGAVARHGYPGLHRLKVSGKWTAAINIQRNKRTYLGTFDTMEEAMAARKLAEQGQGYSDRHGGAACKP